MSIPGIAFSAEQGRYHPLKPSHLQSSSEKQQLGPDPSVRLTGLREILLQRSGSACSEMLQEP